MALVEQIIGMNGIETRNKVQIAIDMLKYYEPMALELSPLGYYLCYSGGKDSDVILELAIMAGVKFTAEYNITTVDPKELILHIKEKREELKKRGYVLNMNPPGRFTTGIFKGQYKTMYKLIVHKKMPPTRKFRYCCDELKERGGKGRMCLTGVRWEESASRSNGRKQLEVQHKDKEKRMLFNDNEEGRMQFENCMQKGKRVLNTIISWVLEDVFEFKDERKLNLCKMYDDGFERLGCIGCPLAGGEQMEKEFKYSPHIRKMYVQAFDRMLEEMRKDTSGKFEEITWKDGEDVMKWYTSQ